MGYPSYHSNAYTSNRYRFYYIPSKLKTEIYKYNKNQVEVKTLAYDLELEKGEVA